MTDNDNKPSPDVLDYIDENLRLVFAELKKEDVPDRFQFLLDQLRAQDNDPKADR